MMRLTRRERGLFLGLVVFITAWLSFVFAVKPAIGRVETLCRVIPEKNEVLQELREKSAQYLTLQAGLDDLKRKVELEEDGFELLTFLESVIRGCGLTEKVVTMKKKISQLDSDYCEAIVEIELDNLAFQQMIELLLKIKSSNHFLRIKSLYAEKNKANPNLLNITIQISTLKQNKAI